MIYEVFLTATRVLTHSRKKPTWNSRDPSYVKPHGFFLFRVSPNTFCPREVCISRKIERASYLVDLAWDNDLNHRIVFAAVLAAPKRLAPALVHHLPSVTNVSEHQEAIYERAVVCLLTSTHQESREAVAHLVWDRESQEHRDAAPFPDSAQFWWQLRVQSRLVQFGSQAGHKVLDYWIKMPFHWLLECVKITKGRSVLKTIISCPAQQEHATIFLEQQTDLANRLLEL